jgi:small subunit ribosomal protein S17
MAKQMRKVRVGSVVRTSMDKTAVVEMVWRQRHPIYQKQMRRVARFYVHDPLKQCRVGDTVRIQETRPISKTKRWRLLEILQRRQVADVQPIELEGDVAPVMTGEALLEMPEPPVGASESVESPDMSDDEEEEARQ